MPLAANSANQSGPRALKYKDLKRTHIEHEADRWAVLRALYCGGRKLFAPKVLEEVYPKHADEPSAIYRERKRRAYYVNHTGTALGNVLDKLDLDPLKLTITASGDGAAFYDALKEDTSAPGGEQRTWWELVFWALGEALQVRRAWMLVDLPLGDGEEPASRADEEEQGRRRAYVVPLPAESVLDWQVGDDGALEWVKVCSRKRPRPTPWAAQNRVVEEYTFYTAEQWVRYRVEYDETPDGEQVEGGKPKPQDDAEIAAGTAAAHTFGVVPVLALELQESLWAMDQVERIARNHLNEQCALSWAHFRYAFAQLYEFRNPDVPGIDAPVGASTPPGQSKSEAHGIGTVHVRHVGESAEYVGPPSDAFEHVRVWLEDVRADIYRVLRHLDLAANTSERGMQRRTAESKRFDQALGVPFLKGLGRLAKRLSERLIELIARGRGGEGAPEQVEVEVTGLEIYNDLDVGAIVDTALSLESVSIPSETFQQQFKLRVARQVLGHVATDELVDKIARELEQNITGDIFQALPPIPPGEEDEEPEDDDEEEGRDRPDR